MAEQDPHNSSDSSNLKQIIAGYLQAVESGSPPDREELIKQHLDLASELRAFFADNDKVKALGDPAEAIQQAKPRMVDLNAATSPPNRSAVEAATITPSRLPQHAIVEETLPLWSLDASGSETKHSMLDAGGRGRYFGDYEILEEIARGGMGVVYKARQTSLNRIVALKMILSGQFASEVDIHRFHAEAEAAANLQHPGIVAIHEVGVCEDRHYFSMDYIEGRRLSDCLSDGPLTSTEAAQLVQTVAEAVHYAHEHGVIHRDLKPANILLDERGHPQVTDFGLARLVTSESRLTATGMILGTPGFMPPEQVAGAKEVGPAADIYSLGAVLYALVTGRPPFRGGTELDALLQVVEQEPTPPRRLNRTVDRALETICLKCLEKEPHKRYGTALQVAEDLDRYLDGEAINAKQLGTWGQLNRWARWYPALAATLVALCLFSVNQLFASYVLKSPGEGAEFRVFLSCLVLLWAAGAAVFQYMTRRPDASAVVIYGWAGMDVLLFTAFLLTTDGPKSTVLLGYLLLIAGAGLRFRPRLVWFVTVLCVSGYVLLIIEAAWKRSHLAAPARAILPFLMSLVIMGLIVHFILRRIRRLKSIDGTQDTRAESRTLRISD